MQNKSVYNGIETYRKNNDKSASTSITVLLIVAILFFSCAFYIGNKILNIDFFKSNILNEEQINNIINIVDEVSAGKAQVNWQQVESIAMVLYDGNTDLIQDDDLVKIAESFLTFTNDCYYVKSYDEELNSLNLKEENINEAKKYYEELKKYSLYGDLYNDIEKNNFIDSLEEQAYINYKTYGILPSITLGQAILESGWGKSELALEHNNLFGIKADSRWNGEIATMVTGENYDDVVEANFRKYNNFTESIQDHGLFLYENERYAVNGVFDAKDYRSQALALQNAGYSTAKNENGELIYADKLINIIKKYNLMIYDTNVKLK